MNESSASGFYRDTVGGGEVHFSHGDGESVPQNLRNVGYAVGITTIKACAHMFGACIASTSVDHPNSITVIEDEAYFCCKILENLRLSSSLQTIGVESFYGCSSITRLELPSTLHTIKKKAFKDCDSLRLIAPQQQHETLSLRTIERWAFMRCHALRTIPHMPSLVTIGPEAFGWCSSLTEVTLGTTVTSAARDSFKNCRSLAVLKCTYCTHAILPWAVTHVTFDSDTTRIHTSAFAGCNQLHGIILPPSVSSLDPSCFWGCKKLPADFMMSNAVIEIGIGAFARCEIDIDNLPHLSTQDIYTFVGGVGEKAPSDVEKVVVHESVGVIQKDNFISCQEMTHLEINSKSITVEKEAFCSKKKLQEVKFHAETIFNIETYAFYECTQLELSEVKWPKSTRLIVDGSFDVKTSLPDLPSISTMHEQAFHCKSQDGLNQYCKTYRVLSKCWKWIISRNLTRKEIQTKKRIHPSSCRNKIYDCLCNEDMDVLREVRSVVPNPRNLVVAIINDLHSYDVVFNNIPRDVVWKVIQFMF